MKCPKCGSENVAVLCFAHQPTKMICDDCGHEEKVSRMGIWNGCGHEVEPVFFSNNVLSVIRIMEYDEENPNELCYDCWAKERGLPYDSVRFARREAKRLDSKKVKP